MRKIKQGITAGLIFAIIDVLIMVPLSLPDKAIAMIASFINRFVIGFFITTTDLPISSWHKGLIIGLLLSLPDAMITKTYAPILGIGIIGGIIIGLIVDKAQ